MYFKSFWDSSDEKTEPPQTDWATSDRLNWNNDEISEWNPQDTEGRKIYLY